MSMSHSWHKSHTFDLSLKHIRFADFEAFVSWGLLAFQKRLS